MWVKNLKTGMTWWVEGELLERLSRSPDYEVVNTAKEPQPDSKSLDDMPYPELRSLAKELGIEDYHKMNTEELREALKEGG